MGTHYGFYGKTLAFISEDQDISVDLARAEGMWEANMLVEWSSRTRRGIMNDTKGRGRRKGGGWLIWAPRLRSAPRLQDQPAQNTNILVL